jgi:acetyl-CoA carboxylase biotin carboxyl carrier protein
MDLSYDDVQNILKIIDASSLEELRLEIGDLKLVVRKRAGRAEVAPEAPPPPTRVETTAAADAKTTARGAPRSRPAGEGEVEVTAPMVGTFYRAPRPGAPPFVEVGAVVGPDDVVCIIEVMKLMNSIGAGIRGRIVEILADNGQLVEYGQALMIIEPE